MLIKKPPKSTALVKKKTDFNIKLTKVENKLSSSNGWTNKLVKKGDYHTKIGEIKNKIASTTGLVKKTDYNAKTAETLKTK